MVKWIGHWIKMKRSGVRFPLLIICGSVGQTSHAILSLPSSDGYLVDTILCLVGSSGVFTIPGKVMNGW